MLRQTDFAAQPAAGADGLCLYPEGAGAAALRSVEFFSSNTFLTILERYVSYYIRRMIDYTDLYYDGKLLETRSR